MDLNRGTASNITQEINNNRFSGNSRTHIGDVYNNNYASLDGPDPGLKNGETLMEALKFDGMNDRLFTVSPACAKTCSWFLQTTEYLQWREPASRSLHNGVLWIKGKAGTGKSTLMRYIHDQEKNSSDKALISFFFNGRSKEALVKSTEGMYRSLLHQLYNTFSPLKTAAAHRYPTTKPHTWTLGVLEDMFREAVLNLAEGEDVVCYVDALDECAIDQVRSAITCFESLTQSATTQRIPFLICFASRYYPQITMRTHVESKLDTQNEHLQDIAKYLDYRLALPTAMKRELQEEIEKRCSGIFLWVVLVVEMLKKSFDEGATRSHLYSLLTSLPVELKALFASISRSADAGFAIALRWVLLSEWPLSYPEGIYFAIRCGLRDLTSAYWDEDEVSLDMMHKYVLHVSRGLIERVPQKYGHDTTQLVHESVREYLLSGSLADLESVPRENLMSVSHAKMAKDCQHYLKLCVHGQRNMMDFYEWTPMDSVMDSYPLGRHAVDEVFPHLERIYLCGSHDINIIDFPIWHWTAVHNGRYRTFRYTEVTYVPEHSANLLTALIECRCFGLAAYYMKTTKWSRSRPRDYIERCELCAAASPSPKIDLSTCCGGSFGSPLQAAVAKRDTHLVKLLLEKGASLNPSEEEFIPYVFGHFDSPLNRILTWYTDNDQADIAQLLLDHGAPVNHVSARTGLTPLYALMQERWLPKMEMTGRLLDRGANVNILTGAMDEHDSRKSTALHLAVRLANIDPDCAELLRLLLNAGADVNVTNGHDDTALIIAVRKKSFDAAKVLLDYGANAEYRSRRHGSAIAAAPRRLRRPLLLECRLRALRGRDCFLPLAVPPPLPQERKPSRIPAPTRHYCKRRSMPLQYRYPPRYQLSWYAHSMGYTGPHDHGGDLVDNTSENKEHVAASYGGTGNKARDSSGTDFESGERAFDSDSGSEDACTESETAENHTGADCEDTTNHPRSEDGSLDHSNAEHDKDSVSGGSLGTDSGSYPQYQRERSRSRSRSRGRSTHRRDSYTGPDFHRSRAHRINSSVSCGSRIRVARHPPTSSSSSTSA